MATAQPVRSTVYTVRITVERDINADTHTDAEEIAKEYAEQINVEIGGSINWTLTEPGPCECDNGHQQNDVVCMWCWDIRGRRHWNDPETCDWCDREIPTGETPIPTIERCPGGHQVVCATCVVEAERE